MEFLSIQYLRGVAALSVVIFHLQFVLTRSGYSGYWPSFLQGGVDIFFIISGFIMWITTVNGNVTVGDFYRRRIVRIVPLYWILTTLVLVCAVFFPKFTLSAKFDLVHVVGSYAFFPVLHPLHHTFEPLLIPGWTLNLEIFFYALFGASLTLRVTHRFVVMLIVLFGLSLIPTLFRIEPLTVPAFYSSGMLMEFGFGIALGAVVIGGKPRQYAFGFFCAAMPLLIYWFMKDGSDARVSSLGMAALSLTSLALLLERFGRLPTMPFLRLLGDSSYSIYLTHAPVLSLTGLIFRGFIRPFTGSLFLLASVSIASTIAIGLISYFYIEIPLLSLMRRRASSKSHFRLKEAGADTDCVGYRARSGTSV